MQLPKKIVDILKLLDDLKTEDVVLYLASREKTVVDYFVLGTCSSPAHIRCVTAKLEEKFEIINFEGFGLTDWVAVDVDEAFVHLFTESERAKYNLDRLLGDSYKSLTYEKYVKTQEKLKAKEGKSAKEKKEKVAKEPKEKKKAKEKKK